MDVHLWPVILGPIGRQIGKQRGWRRGADYRCRVTAEETEDIVELLIRAARAKGKTGKLRLRRDDTLRSCRSYPSL